MQDGITRQAERAEAARDRRVSRRRVLFISGFDPNGPRRYHRLYRAEAARQAAFSGYAMSVSQLDWSETGPGIGAPAFTAACKGPDGAARGVIEILRWDDIARRQMRRSTLSIYLLMFWALWRFATSGALGAMIRLRKGVAIAALYPVGLALIYLATALGPGWAAMAAFAATVDAPLWAGAPLGTAIAGAVMVAARRVDRHVYAFYLICDYAHAAAHAEGGAPSLDDRIAAFGQRIRDAWGMRDCDEVLVVGHSSGAQVAVQAMAAALRAGAGGGSGPALALLTLGQAIPMSSLLPGARALRRDLTMLGDDDRLVWIDVTAPSDGACFALSDPVAVTATRPGRRNPKVISAVFARTLSPETLRRIKWRYFRKHHQYLRAFERAEDYDFFAITAGPVALSARFEGRRSSPRTVRRAIRRFKDVPGPEVAA